MVELRADAQRNLERVLDAATEVFAASGPDASVDEIAKRAGVGHATVFRRFPTKDDLMFAVIERRVEEMRAIAAEALAAEDPGPAFFDFVHRVAELSMSAPGLHKCVAHCGEKPGAAELEALGAKIVARAQRAGALRKDVKPSQVAPFIRDALTAAPEGEWRRYLEVVLDGLRA
ncbi:MAG TPA: helix-turn-helix domain-containing protein [Gaiellaceae bacterium]|nr:helix-turn-helix domain-containing protein [Gaiellaceae bacterium]